MYQHQQKGIVMDEEQIAVRWAHRKVRMELDYSRWHMTKPGDALETMCGRVVPVGLEGTFLPEVEDIMMVDCALCLKVQRKRLIRLAMGSQDHLRREF